MISLLALLLFYFIIVFLLTGIVTSIVAFLRSETKPDKMLWASLPIIFILILSSIIVEFCINFCSDIMEAVNLQIVTNVALLLAFLSAACFMSLIVIAPRLTKK